ncbi:asparagine synthase (glutamine-hydrolyzing) [uncultured Marivita sp.]|uniref:asparagine synthase (glutamine-hydrolyzing) n=1 Tax=uncultured Marivita sp. TaxID=888080 RepID=UPI002633A1A9|nr:asparagine synthase (glutamine-hydrolyzing) [uncultured Marivita sp.]
MCGLAGFVAFDPFPDPEKARRALLAMTRAIKHRGPDAEGYWLDDTQGVALGHRRLSILDLSPAGAQPMQSPCGRYILVFNGEIYNHGSLRLDLENDIPGSVWAGHSDTETLLVAITEWGLTRTLEKAFGMFALALWDRQERVLSLARDRMGEKPLYFSRQDHGWVFGSELRALLAGGLAAPVDRGALVSYLELGYVPDHMCILAGVGKIMPGTIIQLREGGEPEQLCYASVEAQFGQPAKITDRDEAVTRLERALGEVVSEQMVSDVPLGCFLSGGVDSSLVASLMQAKSDRQIQTFSIGFEDAWFNEAPHAAAVAAHLKTSHTEFTLKEDDALAIIPDLPSIYDEPFADSSQIPTTLLCRSARKHVTVALTGDGGDEVFGGYNRHIRGPKLWNQVVQLPRILRHLGAGAVDGAAQLALRNERISRRATTALGLPLTTLDNLPKLAATLRTAGHAEDFYQTFISTGQSLADTLLDPAPPFQSDPRAVDPSRMMMAEWIMARDMTGYLPGDILVKVDRAAMSVGLETRAPFLDARVAAVARQIPIELHVDQRTGKKLLRELLYRYVPQSLIERPKQGFAMPLDDWLRESLRDWGSGLIKDEALVTSLGLDRNRVEDIWSAHQAKHINAGKALWTLLMLLLWARNIGIGTSADKRMAIQGAEASAPM